MTKPNRPETDKTPEKPSANKQNSHNENSNKQNPNKQNFSKQNSNRQNSSKSSQNRGGGKPGRVPIDLHHYPNAEKLPAEKGPKNIEIIELASPDDWQVVLNFYQKSLLEQQWQQFAENMLADRGSLSFRSNGITLSILVAEEEDGDTHIRIYIQS